MKMVGHKTEAIYRRYAIVDSEMLKEAGAKLAAVGAVGAPAAGIGQQCAVGLVGPAVAGRVRRGRTAHAMGRVKRLVDRDGHSARTVRRPLRDRLALGTA